MTSKNSFLAKRSAKKYRVYHMDLLNRRLWIGVLSLILQVLMYSIATPLRIVYERSQAMEQLTSEAARIAYQQNQAQTIFGQMCLSTPAMLLTMLLAVLIAHQGFSYVFSRRELDFYMSQPVKRIHHFRDVYLNGLLIFAIPYVMSVMIGVLVALSMHSMTWQVFCEILYGIVRMIIFFLSYYSISIIAVLVAGREAFAILATGFLMVAEIAFRIMLSVLREVYLVTYYSRGTEIFSFGNLFATPAYTFYQGRRAILSLMSLTGTVNSGYDVLAVDRECFIYLLFLALVAFVLATFAFVMRRSEYAGSGICFRPVSFVVKMYCAVVGAIIVAVAFDEIFSNVDWAPRTWMVFLFTILGAFLITSFGEALLQRNIKAFFLGWRCTVVSCVIALGLIIGYRWDVAGYDSYVPKAEDVESYAFVPIGTNNYRSFSRMSDQGYYNMVDAGLVMKLTDVEPMIQIAEVSQEKLVEKRKDYPEGFSLKSLFQFSANRDDSDSEGYWDAVVLWRLKNGRTIVRRMGIPESIDPDQMDAITTTDEYKRYRYFLDNMADLAGISSLNVTYNVGYDTAALNDVNYMVQDFMQAYASDLIQYGFSFARDNEAIGTINWWGNGSDVYYEVYPSYTNTIAFLRRYELYREPVPSIEEVAVLSVEKSHFNSMDYSYNTESIVITDSGEITTILSSIQDPSIIGEWQPNAGYGIEYDEDGSYTDYDVQLTLQTNGVLRSDSTWVEFIGDVPEWVKEKFE